MYVYDDYTLFTRLHANWDFNLFVLNLKLYFANTNNKVNYSLVNATIIIIAIIIITIVLALRELFGKRREKRDDDDHDHDDDCGGKK